MNISEGLALYKSLKKRYDELVELRTQSSEKERRFYGSSDKEIIKEPTYRVKDVDKKVNLIAKELRKLDSAIKVKNLTTPIDFVLDEEVWDAIE